MSIDGNWNTAFATWTFDYFAYSMLSALVWVVIILGIPVAIGLVWWTRHEMRKKP
jgi:membrane protein DedA with SNARE-associated domain